MPIPPTTDYRKLIEGFRDIADLLLVGVNTQQREALRDEWAELYREWDESVDEAERRACEAERADEAAVWGSGCG